MRSVTVRLGQGHSKTVDLDESGAGGVKLQAVISRAFLDGWDDSRTYYINGNQAAKDTLVYGGEEVVSAKRHDNG